MNILLTYGALAILAIVLGVFFYMLSVKSRKDYVCPACGERVRTEHLEASHCSSCGAPLDRAGD